MIRTVITLTTLAVLSGCAPATTPRTELVVYAASSLSDSYASLGTSFEAAHPGVTVKYSFDGSSALVDQLKQGAPADVFASADRPNMDKATTAGLMSGTPSVFATNTLTIIVPKGNPAGITGLDSSLAGKKLVVCADGVPCGTATTKLATLLGVTLKPVSQETKVGDVRAKVESGQADAGVVYVTDAKASGSKVDMIAIANAAQVTNEYLVGVVATSKRSVLASQFVALVTGSEGQKVLSGAGFTLP
ncbi:MAG: molybdate ABC transporter substrate-binding protein [Propionibacteriaceae bacterium]